MARQRRRYTDPRNFWGNWDPRECERVWIDNDVYSDLNKELEYLRLHPKKADPSKLINLMERMISQWNGERESFRRSWREVIEQYNNLVSEVNSQTEEIDRLNEFIVQINKQVEETFKRQEQLQAEIDEIKNDKNKNEELARRYLNETIEAYNLIVNDPYYRKFVPEKIEALKFVLQRIEDTELDAAAIQGIAVDCLAKLFAMNKEVLRKRAEFEMLYSVIKEDAEELKNQYNHWDCDVYFDPDNENQADMGFWSRGLFNEYMGNVDEICHELEKAPDDPSIMTEDLKVIQNELINLRQYGEETVTNVLACSLQSEKTEALANITAIIMVEDFFFNTIYMGFNDDDERSSYVVQLNNHASGIKMQFVFTPLNGSNIGCNYTVSFDGYQDEDRVNRILDAIWSQLMPNKVNPNIERGEVKEHIVERIEFGTPGRPIHLKESVA